MFNLVDKAMQGLRNDVKKIAIEYANEVGEALMVIRSLEALMVKPIVEFDSRLHFRIEFGKGSTMIDSKRIIVIYSLENKKPIYAYLKEPEKETE
jgi:hypothetical protein